MIAEALAQEPLSPRSGLGPHRRPDYERLPDEPRHELLYGRLYVTPSPTARHQRVSLLLSHRLDALSREIGGMVFTAPLDVALADHTVVQPDLLYLSPERQHRVQERIEGPPDLAVEIVSPRTARRDRGEKLRAYAELGVREYWIVDPAARQIEFLTNRDGHFQVELPLDGVYRSPLLPGIALDVVELWSEVEKRFPG
jgi:Uma2 family endonuclease